MSIGSHFDQFPRIKAELVVPCKEAKRQEMMFRILRHKTYPAWLEEKLATLADTPNLEAVLSEIRHNPSQFDDYIAIMKIAAYFVRTFNSNLEFLAPSKSKRSPDIRITTKEGDTFIEVKHLIDNSHWDTIQDGLRLIPSGLWVDIQVDYKLSRHDVNEIIETTKKALRRAKSKFTE